MQLQKGETISFTTCIENLVSI